MVRKPAGIFPRGFASMRKLAPVLLSFLLIAPCASVAFAHAELEAAIPAADATVQEAPKSIEIDFSEELNQSLCRIEVQDSTGIQVDKGDTHVSSDDQKHLSVDLNPLGGGTYKVSWIS